jgi:ketosteroid isomerase-like protein
MAERLFPERAHSLAVARNLALRVVGETEGSQEMDGLDQAVERYHAALGEFVKGRYEPSQQMFSQRDDVVLCNPFRPFARGPREVAETTAQAASHFADGEIAFERVSTFATPELAYILELERFSATLDGTEGSGSLRVTTLFRPEDDGWKVVHRHADPITTPQAIGSILQK